MAEKRMLSKKVLDTDAFLDMPLSAQALYFHLAVNADDEGFVGNPKRIRDYIGASENDLNLLVEKRFVLIFKNGVVVIRHWKIHNTLRRDRSHPTIFTEEKALLIVGANGAYMERPTTADIADNQTATACQPSDGQMSTEDKIGEDSVSEDMEDESGTLAIDEIKTTRFKKPTVDEIKAYCTDNGYSVDALRFFDYYESNGWRVGKTPMKDWQATVRNWVRREQQQPQDVPRIAAEKYKRED